MLNEFRSFGFDVILVFKLKKAINKDETKHGTKKRNQSLTTQTLIVYLNQSIVQV